MPPKASENQPAPMTLEEALDNISMSGCHFNFGKNIEARGRYYERRAEAIRIAREAGYVVLPEPKSFGFTAKAH